MPRSRLLRNLHTLPRSCRKLLVYASWVSAAATASQAAVADAQTPPWQAMDYGPYLTASIEAPEPRTNIAYKGIAINLGGNFGGDHNEAVVFDTDLLRYSAGWTGDFLALKGVVFDGEHWAYPRINGTQVFGNLMAPGWAKAGRFTDPRDYHYGPLPRDWAHWKGLYLHEKKVVLSYSVGSMDVLEMPGLERYRDLTAFVRTLNLEPSTVENEVQLAYQTNGSVQFVDITDPQAPAQIVAPEKSLALLRPAGPASSKILAVAVTGTTGTVRWPTNQNGRLRLLFVPSATATRCKIFLWSGPPERLRDFANLVRAASAPEDLASFTHGGPPRWREKPVSHGQLGQEQGPYALDTLTEPQPNPWHSWMRFGGLDFFPDGKRLAVCTWNGDVWIVSGVDGDLKNLTWQRIATGLFQPLGLQIVDGEIYVLGRDQITRLHDFNGDGEADFYENFNNDCLTSEHFHEFALDLKLGPDGNFYYIKCACHGLPASHPHHGTLLRVSRDGSKLEVVARGFRAANGLGVGPHGEFTCIDNQGYWMPANRINWIKPGGWYGNQWAWNPEHRTNYDEPLCWMHNFVDRSGGTQLWVPTDQWGPFRDQIITISYGMGHMFLLLKEEVGGLMQGAVTRFPLEFDTGVMRGVFHPQTGQLYTCGLYGWAGNKTKAGGIYRVRYTDKPLHMPDELHFVRDGIVLGFTDSLEPDSATDPGNYDVKAWNYHWTINYGSPDFKLTGQEGRDTWTVKSATLSADHKRVFLAVPDAQRVMQLHVVFHLRAADGAEIDNFVHGTIHQLDAKTGLDWLGPGAVTRADNASISLAREAPGLIQTFDHADNLTQHDTRGVRLPALLVPAHSHPTPFLDDGHFRCRWDGFLKVPLNDRVTFELTGRGAATLKLEGQVVLDTANGSLAAVPSQPVSLRRGLNRFELDYDSPAQGDAQLRLAWSSKHLALEPVPPTAFVHDANNSTLAQRSIAREGRRLFASFRCIRCHQPASALPATAMPELAADAPSLLGIAGRLKETWIAQWLLDPVAFRREATMPRLLSGLSAKTDAADIAAYLGGLSDANEPGDRAVKVASGADKSTASGAKLFAELGCVACHVLPGDSVLTNDSRLALDYLADKWRPEALPAFLRAPNRHYQWTRMPDFKLSSEEASALSRFLLERSRTSVPVLPLPSSAQPSRSADPGHGQELVSMLGCLNCHALERSTNHLLSPSLAALQNSDWQRGCLAEDKPSRGQAPDFNFTPGDRLALRTFARDGFPNSLVEDPPSEFATRQYDALRCQACHPRDDQPDRLTQLTTVTKPSSADDDDFTHSSSVHVGRPPLTFAGEKLYAGWMQRFLAGTLPYKPRPELQGRMPAFPVYAAGLAAGLANQHSFPMESAPTMAADPALANIGRQLTEVGSGFSCVACHNVGEHKALAGQDTATVNFACITERLRPEYYWRYVQDPARLLPGTMMPKFIGEDGTTAIKTIYRGDPQKQFAAIWQYLLSLAPGQTALNR